MNKIQRVILIGIGLTIGFVQINSIIDRNLDDNHGWAFALLISAALLFIGFSSFRTLNLSFLKSKLLGKKSNETNKTDPLKEKIDRFESNVNENQRIITNFSEQFMGKMFNDLERVQTTKGSMANWLSSTSRSGFLLYSLGLLIVAKMQTCKTYLSSNEYKKTKERIIYQGVIAEIDFHGINNITIDRKKICAKLFADMTDLEEAIIDYLDNIHHGDTKSPTDPIDSWFKKNIGFSEACMKTVYANTSHESFSVANIETVYNMVYAPAESF